MKTTKTHKTQKQRREYIKAYNKKYRAKQEKSIEVSILTGNRFKRWDIYEEKALIKLRKQGVSYGDCAYIMCRSFRSIENKLHVLRKQGVKI